MGILKHLYDFSLVLGTFYLMHYAKGCPKLHPICLPETYDEKESGSRY